MDGPMNIRAALLSCERVADKRMSWGSRGRTQHQHPPVGGEKLRGEDVVDHIVEFIHEAGLLHDCQRAVGSAVALGVAPVAPGDMDITPSLPELPRPILLVMPWPERLRTVGQNASHVRLDDVSDHLGRWRCDANARALVLKRVLDGDDARKKTFPVSPGAAKNEAPLLRLGEEFSNLELALVQEVAARAGEPNGPNEVGALIAHRRPFPLSTSLVDVSRTADARSATSASSASIRSSSVTSRSRKITSRAVMHTTTIPSRADRDQVMNTRP